MMSAEMEADRKAAQYLTKRELQRRIHKAKGMANLKAKELAQRTVANKDAIMSGYDAAARAVRETERNGTQPASAASVTPETDNSISDGQDQRGERGVCDGDRGVYSGRGIIQAAGRQSSQ
jgi:hypothetical protein